jgi:hypothetical protein
MTGYPPFPELPNTSTESRTGNITQDFGARILKGSFYGIVLGLPMEPSLIIDQSLLGHLVGLFRTMLGNNTLVKMQPRTTSSNGTGSLESENQSAYMTV